MLRAPAATTLHVTNGDSVTGTMQATALGGATLSWVDVLHEGPVPAVPDGELLHIRAGFLAEAGWGTAAEIRAELERRDAVLAEAFAAGRPVVLWFEHDLFDQLQLIQVLSQCPRPPELIVIAAFEGRPDFRGLGELSADELETLWPLRAEAPDGALELARAAWDAFRSPDPRDVEPLAAGDTGALPFLGAALRRLLEELPSPKSGLSRSERQLLESLDEARRPYEVFLAGQAREEAPYEGDAWTWRRLAALGTGENRLLAPVGGGPTPAPPPLGDGPAFAATEFELTDSGRAVLAGSADRVDLLGLDRWLGGTHLTRENDWRWDRDQSRLVSPS